MIQSPADELNDLMRQLNHTFNSLLFIYDILGYILRDFHDGEFIVNKDDFEEFRSKYRFGIDDMKDVFILKVVAIDE